MMGELRNLSARARDMEKVALHPLVNVEVEALAVQTPEDAAACAVKAAGQHPPRTRCTVSGHDVEFCLPSSFKVERRGEGQPLAVAGKSVAALQCIVV